MSDKQILAVKKRDLNIKGKKYQAEGYILGNISGHGASQAIALPLRETTRLLNTIGESSVFYVVLDEDKKEIPVLLQEVQVDPITNKYVHIALKKVSLKEKVRAFVAFSLTGELTVPDALTLLTRQEVEAEALPTDLPSEFVLDISKFTEVGQQITFADLDYDRSKVTLMIEDENEPIVVVSQVKEEVEEVAPAEETEAGAEATEAAEATAEAGAEAEAN
ncbi:MAG: hypothetical protein Q4G02_02045 [bacterium]|nr:hypothetical protein [bacterium]